MRPSTSLDTPLLAQMADARHRGPRSFDCSTRRLLPRVGAVATIGTAAGWAFLRRSPPGAPGHPRCASRSAEGVSSTYLSTDFSTPRADPEGPSGRADVGTVITADVGTLVRSTAFPCPDMVTPPGRGPGASERSPGPAYRLPEGPSRAGSGECTKALHPAPVRRVERPSIGPARVRARPTHRPRRSQHRRRRRGGPRRADRRRSPNPACRWAAADIDHAVEIQPVDRPDARPPSGA
jgi:hypothetical protein